MLTQRHHRLPPRPTGGLPRCWTAASSFDDASRAATEVETQDTRYRSAGRSMQFEKISSPGCVVSAAGYLAPRTT
eukprot:365734-Chlamydomonas_euryale.AAC.9